MSNIIKETSSITLLHELRMRLMTSLWYLWLKIRGTVIHITVSTCCALLVVGAALKTPEEANKGVLTPIIEASIIDDVCKPEPLFVSEENPIDEVAREVATPKKVGKKKASTYKGKGAIPGGLSVFQATSWHLKSHESFRPRPYEDGAYPSIGFGLNLTGAHKTWGAGVLGLKRFPREITWEQGSKLLEAYINEKLMPQVVGKGLTPQQQVATMVHIYNTGNSKSVGGCCGKNVGCGARKKNIRKVHTSRRTTEIRWVNNRMTLEELHANQQRAAELQRRYK